MFRWHSQDIRYYHIAYQADCGNEVRVDICAMNNKHHSLYCRLPQQALSHKRGERAWGWWPKTTCRIIFAEKKLPRRLMSFEGTNFVSRKFQDFCRCLEIHHVMSSSHDGQNNRQAEACTTFLKQTMKTFLESNTLMHMVLLQVRSLQIGPILPNGVVLLFNWPAGGCLQSSIGYQCYVTMIEATILFNMQSHKNIDKINCRNILFCQQYLAVAVQHEGGGPWTHGTVVGHISDDHHSRSYRISVSKVGHIITRTSRRIKSTPITAYYLEN